MVYVNSLLKPNTSWEARYIYDVSVFDENPHQEELINIWYEKLQLNNPHKGKLPEFHGVLGLFLKKNEYIALSLDNNLQQIEETQILYAVIVQRMDHMNLKLFQIKSYRYQKIDVYQNVPARGMIVLLDKPHQEHVNNIEYFIWKMYVPYRKLNSITKLFALPNPRCNNTIDIIGGGFN